MGERPPAAAGTPRRERAASFDPPLSAWSAAEVLPETRPHEGDRRADVAVVGAGFTDLSAVLHPAERGADVVVLDAAEPGWGGSGRNGGQGIPGLTTALGATYPPTWMDEPMIYADNDQELAPGMVFFVHMILLKSRTGLSMCLGETSIVTRRGADPVTHALRALVVN